MIALTEGRRFTLLVLALRANNFLAVESYLLKAREARSVITNFPLLIVAYGWSYLLTPFALLFLGSVAAPGRSD